MANSDEPSDCRTLVQQLAFNNFDITVLSQQEKDLRAQCEEIQRKIEEAIRSVGGVAVDGEPEGLSKKESQELTQQKRQLDADILDVGRKIAQLQAQESSAKEYVVKAMSESVFSSSEARNDMKRAILDLANKVDPKSAWSAESLGKMMLRTPWFFKHHGLLGGNRTRQDTESRSLKPLPPVAIDLESWDVYEQFEQVGAEAAAQNEQAINQMLALLVHDGLSGQLRNHLLHILHEKATYTAFIDQERFEEVKDRFPDRCAVSLHFPARDEGAPNAKAYSQIRGTLSAQAQEYDFSDGARQRPGTSELSGAKQRANARRNVSQPEETALDRFLKTLDANFKEVQGKDPLLHITPHVAEALLKIAADGWYLFHREEVVLYGCAENINLKYEEPHWFLRRRAALKICEMAAEGNIMAVELIVKKLVRDQEHWMVRSIVMEEVCRMLRDMHPEHPHFRELVDELTRAALVLPPVANINNRLTNRQQIELKATANVQRTVEEMLIKELPHYSEARLVIVLQDLQGKCREDNQKQQILDRIKQAAGIQHERKHISGA